MPEIYSIADVQDEEVRKILGQVDARGGTAPFEIAQKRRAYVESVARAGPPEAIAEIHEESSPNGTRVRVYCPAKGSGALPVLLYVHGGGFLSGDLDTHDPICRALAKRLPAVVVGVAYSLTPECPYPAALNDCLDVLKWIPARAGEWGADAAALLVAGDSAGGNLAAAITNRSRETDMPAVSAQVLVYPMLDATLSSRSLIENALVPPFTLIDCVFAWQQYLPNGPDRRAPQISPLFMPDLSGVPRTMVITAGFDILRDEGVRYVERLRGSGVPVVHEDFRGMVHGFFQWGGTVLEARRAMDRVIEFLRNV